MQGDRVALAPGPTPSPGEGSPDSDAGREYDIRRHVGRASVTPGAGDRADGAVAAGSSAASGSSAFATPAGRASPATPSGREDDVASLVPSWAWLPRGTEVFALADPTRCRPYLSPPVASDEQRAPHVAEPLFFVGDGERDVRAENAREDLHSAWRLTEPSEGSPYAATIKDSTREPFEVRARADWHPPRSDAGTSPSPSPSPSYSPASSAATTPRSSSGASAFAFLTPISSERGDASTATTPGFDHATDPGMDDDPPGFVRVSVARALSFASLSVRSAFTKKYLQARRKPPHRVQFYSDRRGLYETWEVVGGATAADDARDVAATSRAWRPWGVVARAAESLAPGTDVAARRTPGTAFDLADDETARGVDEAVLAKAAFVLFGSPTRGDASQTGEGKAAIETLAGRSFCVARSRRCPDRALLLVRLRLPSGESPGFDSPGASSSARTPHRSARPPRHSAPSSTPSADTSMRFAAATPPPPPTVAAGLDKIRAFEGGASSPESPASSRSRSARSSARFAHGGGSPAGSPRQTHVDAMDVMAMSGKLLKGFALKPEVRRRRSSIAGAFHAWWDAVETERRLETLRRRAARAWTSRRSGGALRAWRAAASRSVASRERLAAALASVAARVCAPRFARESRWFAGLAWRAWRDVARAEVRRRLYQSALEHRALALAYTSRASRCFRAWRVSAAVASSSLFAQRRAEAAAGGYLRRLRRASFARWRGSAQPDARRRRAAVLDAELARNESRALFSAVREARRKETLRVFSSQWQRYVARRGVGRAAVALADRVLRRRRQTASFREWRDSAATALDEATANDALAEKHDRARTRRVDRSARLATVGAWRAAVSAARKVRADAVRAEVFFRTVSRRTFRIRFSGWASAARASHYKVSGRALMIRRAERAELFAHRLVLRRKRETFTAYRRVVAGAKRTRRRVGALVAKRVRNATVPAFRAWAETAWELRRRRAFGARMSSKSARRTSVTAFIAWRDATKARRLARRLERRADASAARARRRAAFAALAAWTDAFRYRRSVATFVRLARRRARRRAATGALARWRVAIATARVFRAAGVVAVARDARRAARRRFDDWRLRAAEARRLASSRVRVARARREGRRLAAARRIVRGWSRHAGTQTRRVRAFFDTHFARRRVAVARRATRAWRYAARDARSATAAASRAEAVVARAAARRAARLTRDALLGWAARASRRAASQRRASRLASRRERRGSARALALWRARVADVAAARLAVDASARRREARRAAAAFESWRVATAFARRVRGATLAMARRRRAARLALTLRAWRAHASAKARARRLISRLAARRTRRAAAAALRAWRASADFSRAAARVVAKARERRAGALVASAFGAWRDRAARNAGARRAALREARIFATLAARRARRAVAWSLAAWRLAAAASRRETRLLAKAARRSARGTLASAFAAWRDASALAAREKRVLAKISKRWSKLGLASAFTKWCDASASARREKASITKIAARWSKLALASAFDAWLARRDAVRKHAARTLRLERLASRVSARAASAALGAWLDAAAAQKARRVASTKIAKRWLEATRRDVLAAWREVALGSIRARAVASRFATRRAARRAASALATWREWSRLAATFKRRASRFVSGSQSRLAASAWRAWRLALARARAVDAAVVGRVSHFARRVRRRRAARAFAALRARSRATMHARDAAETLARFHVRRRVAVRFRRWRDAVYRGAYLRALMRRLLSMRWTRVARAAFGGWRRRAARAAAFDTASEAAAVRFHAARRRVARGAFERWRRRADGAARARLAAEKKELDLARRAAEAETARRKNVAKTSADALDAARARNAELAALICDARAESAASRADAEERRAEAETLRAVLADREKRVLARANAPPRASALAAPRGGLEDVAEAVVAELAELETPAPARDAASADGSPLSPPAMRTANAERRAPEGESPGDESREEGRFAAESRDAKREKEVTSARGDEPEATRFSSPGGDAEAILVREIPETATSPATSAESRLDRALRAGAVAEARARRAGAATPKASPTSEPNRGAPVPTPSAAGARRTFPSSPRARRLQSPDGSDSKSPLASAAAFAAESVFDPHVFAAEAKSREAEACRRERDEGAETAASGDAAAARGPGAPIAYALVRSSGGGAPGDAAVSVFRAEKLDADALSLAGSHAGSHDAVDVVVDRGGVPFRKRHEFERVFWCARDATSEGDEGDEGDETEKSLRRVAAEVSAPMAFAARAGTDATLFVCGGRASGTTSAADAVAAALAARVLATASARNERLEYLEALAEKNRFRETPSAAFHTTRVVCRFAAYQTRGLVADDLLAGHAGARGLRVRPATTHEPKNTHSSDASAGLAYEVEGLSKIEVTSLSHARRLLEACRSRRRDAKREDKASPDAFVCEWWLETVTEITSAAFGVRSRVSRSARARVVDVYGDAANDAGDANNANAPAFALAQCASARASALSRSGVGDWRQSALTKLSKAPLTMRGGLVSVLVTMGVANAEAESAETALRFAGAVRGLERAAAKSPGVFFARTERAVETSRRERLETKLAATRAEARRGGVTHR